MDHPVGLDGLVNGALAVVGICDVGDHRNCFAALGFDGGLGRVDPLGDRVNQHESSAFARHQDRGGRAVADALASVGSGAADDRHPAVES